MRPRPATNQSDIAKRIREGMQKRQEEQRRLQQLQQDFREVTTEQAPEDFRGKHLLPSIIIYLLFVSLPLSERVIDWLLVGLVTLLNVGLALVGVHSTWTCVLLVAMCNWILLDRSRDLYELPNFISSLPPCALPAFGGGNIILFCVLYYTVVGRCTARDARGGRLFPSQKMDEASKEKQVLEDFAAKREREKRLDLVVSFITLVNVVVLIYTGFIPVGNLKRGVLVLTRLFSG